MFRRTEPSPTTASLPTATTVVAAALALAVTTTLAAACARVPDETASGAKGITATAPVSVLYLVRHAETAPAPDEQDPPDPRLRDAGRERARALAHLLEDEPIETVFSTGYRRTRETAGPVAEAHGLEVTIYDAGDLEAFAERLRGIGGRHVVVGHSNTTPMLVEALGGEPGTPIDESWEYDRLYVVTLDAGGGVRTHRLRYGAPSQPS